LSPAGMALPYRRVGSKSMGGSVRGLTSLAESNRVMGSLNLHDWCFRLARQAPSLRGEAPEVDREIDAPDVEVQAYF